MRFSTVAILLTAVASINGQTGPGASITAEATTTNTPGQTTAITTTARPTTSRVEPSAAYTECGTKYENGFVCTDVNECLTNNGGCDSNATCINTVGSFTCVCKLGYSGDGRTCFDINECATNNGGCHNEATCTNLPGNFTCTCNPGYTGCGVTCTDHNECLKNNGGCDVHATCTNTPGSFTCACIRGYSGDGRTCIAKTDINECETNNGGCDPQATCTNTTGSLTCTCNPGFTGDGQNCTALPIALNYTFPGLGAVYSVLSSKNQLFAAQGYYPVNNQIAVFDNSNFQFDRYISIPTTTSIIYGLAISSDESVLYASDINYNRVFAINLTTSTLSATWSVASEPVGLSINRAGNLLVACGSAYTIQEYTPSGSLVRETSSSSYPWQALELSPGLLLVSRTYPTSDVCMMSTNGTVSTCYGSTPGSGPGQLNYPRSLAVHAEGYILVADSNNNRVMILNPSLTQGVPLPLQDPNSWPIGLSFDTSRAQLFVANGNMLVVFDNVVNLGAYFD